MLLFVASFGSAPAASSSRIISMSAAALARRNGVAPIDIGVAAGESRWTLRHRHVRIGATREQRLHELQLRLALGNAAHRVGETEDRIRFAALPCARGPMQRRHARIARIRIGALLEQEQRERHMRSHCRDKQRRAAGRDRRFVARATASPPPRTPLAPAPAGPSCSAATEC